MRQNRRPQKPTPCRPPPVQPLRRGLYRRPMKPPHPNRHGGSGRPPSGGGVGGPSRHHAPHGQSNDGQQRRDRAAPGQSQGVNAQYARPQGPRPDGQPDHRGTRPQGKPFQTRPNQENQHRDRPRNDFHRSDRQRDQGPRHTPDTPRGAVWLYGLHAVAAALANPSRRLRHLMLTEEAQQTLTQRLPPPWPLAPEQVDRGRIDHLLGRDIAHQGAALLGDPLAPPSLHTRLKDRARCWSSIRSPTRGTLAPSCDRLPRSALPR